METKLILPPLTKKKKKNVENQNNGQEQKGQTRKTTDCKHNAYTNTDIVTIYIAGIKRQGE
jgi:hypothetical protein